jgi:hypothetical protein
VVRDKRTTTTSARSISVRVRIAFDSRDRLRPTAHAPENRAASREAM